MHISPTLSSLLNLNPRVPKPFATSTKPSIPEARSYHTTTASDYQHQNRETSKTTKNMAHMLQYPSETHPCYSPTCTFASPKCYSPTCVNASSRPASSRGLIPLDGNQMHVFAPPMVYKVHNPPSIARSGSKISSLRKITRKIMALTRAVPRIEVTPPPSEGRGNDDAGVEERKKGKGVREGNYNLLHPDPTVPATGPSLGRKEGKGATKVRFAVETGEKVEVDMQFEEFRYLVAKGLI
ncbi:MAG: hypothetical protein Q9184_008244 [Pyrenodesmia sp. 2 TL-2023]